MSSSTLQDGSHVPPQFDMNTVPAPEKSLVPFPGVSDSDKPSPMQSNNLGDLINRFVLVRPVKNPKSYDRRFKWFVTILVAASSAIDPMSSTIFYRKMPLNALPCKILLMISKPHYRTFQLTSIQLVRSPICLLHCPLLARPSCQSTGLI